MQRFFADSLQSCWPNQGQSETSFYFFSCKFKWVFEEETSFLDICGRTLLESRNTLTSEEKVQFLNSCEALGCYSDLLL